MVPIVWLLILSFAATNPLTEGVWLTIPNSGTKCVSEMIHTNVVVLGEYYSIDHEKHELGIPVSAKVTSPYGNVLHQQENATYGQWAFTTTESGNYMACFWHDAQHQSATSAISLEWRSGVNAKDWESVAKKEKIDGVEVELLKLKQAVEAILNNLGYLKEREAEMREVSEKTNGRIVWLSVMSVGLCIGASSWQIFYLKRYFQKRKLI